jgi:hypothetical protein
MLIELDCGDPTDLLDSVMPPGVWIRMDSGGLLPTILVRGPVEGVVQWVNTVYSGGPNVPPIMNDDGTFTNNLNPGAPKGY